LSISFTDENVNTKDGHLNLTSQTPLFLHWFKTRQDRRTYAQEFELFLVNARSGDLYMQLTYIPAVLVQ
jgi:hypothetical protein